MPARVGLGVEGSPLVRILAVGKIEHFDEGRCHRLREGLAIREPGGDRGFVRGRGRERFGSELTACLRGELAGFAQLVEDEAVLFGSRENGNVGEVLCRGSHHRRTADIDHLDCVFLAYAVAGHDLGEGVEVRADEIKRLDLVLVE